MGENLERMNRVHREALEKDIDILLDLYESRIKTVDQLSRKHDYKKSSMYHKLGRMRNKGYITTQNIKGFSSRSKNIRGLQGKCYKITNSGITYLRKLGYDLEFDASYLKVSDMRVPILLLTLDLFEEMSSRGWSYMDSRLSKYKYSLNRGLNFDGILSSPNSFKYPFYIMLENTTDTYIRRVRTEIERLNFDELLFFTRSPSVFNRLFDELLTNGEVFLYKSVRILPFGFGWRYLVYYDDSQVMFNYLEDNFNIYEVNKNEGTHYQVGFKTVTEYKNEEYYLVNMVDHNLTNIHFIKNYSKERYLEDGRKIMLLHTGLFDYEKLLSDIQHILFIKIDGNDLLNYPLV